jgi:hypothetical protein
MNHPDLCDWCGQPMRQGEECRVAIRRKGLPLFWHLECVAQGIRPFNASADADSAKRVNSVVRRDEE